MASIEYRNSAQVTGRLTQAPTVQERDGFPFAQAYVAVQDGRGQLANLRISVYGDDAEAWMAEKDLQRGAVVDVIGELRSNQWTDKQTSRRETRQFIFVEQLTILERAPDAPEAGNKLINLTGNGEYTKESEPITAA